MRKLFGFLLGFLLGAMVGAAITVMLAPESGEDMRSRVQIRMDQVIEEGKRAAIERRAELEAQLEELKKGNPTTC